MQFSSSIDPERYDDFVRTHKTKSHFMQSPAWGELNERQKGNKYFLCGLLDERGELCAAALLLERKPPLMPPYIYSPRGFVVDFSNEALLGELTRGVVSFCRERGAMFLKIDPDVERRELDRNGGVVPDGFDNSDIVERLLALGFSHRGFNMGFDRRQPRFTFRIDLEPDEEEIARRMTGNVLKNAKKGERYAADISLGSSDDVKTLHRLIELTGERDDFYGYSLDYYQAFYDTLAARGMARLYIGRVYPVPALEMLRARRTELEKKRETLKKPGAIAEAAAGIDRLGREIAAFERYAEQYPEGADVSAHLVVQYGGHAWAVHAGSSTEMNESFINNRVYVYKLFDAKRRGAVWLDQFGTVGDPENSPLKSLHEFKRQFGGRYCEFIGEFDYVLKPFWYFLYEKALPKYRAFRFWLKEKKRERQK